jgi:hypothetical protein
MLRELDQRTGDGVTVTLFWDTTFNRTLIQLADRVSDLNDLFHVPAYAAADAFEHPFYYRDGTDCVVE